MNAQVSRTLLPQIVFNQMSMNPKPCSVCVLCAVCLGGMYRQYFCSGLLMVMAVNVVDIWELLRLPCSRLAHFRNLPGGGG